MGGGSFRFYVQVQSEEEYRFAADSIKAFQPFQSIHVKIGSFPLHSPCVPKFPFKCSNSRGQSRQATQVQDEDCQGKGFERRH